MLKVKMTWPLLIVLVFALFAWLIREQRPPVAQKTRAYTPRAPHTPRRAKVIRNQPDVGGDDDAVSDYDAETARLDREAVENARSEFESQMAGALHRMRRGAWQ